MTIQKCDRCPQIEELAEGYRVALIEAAKLIEFILLPSTTEAERAEIRLKAFGNLSEASPGQDGPPTPPSATEAPKTSCRVIEHGPAGDPNCPDCRD